MTTIQMQVVLDTLKKIKDLEETFILIDAQLHSLEPDNAESLGLFEGLTRDRAAVVTELQILSNGLGLPLSIEP